jgi:hypothetical protein
VGVPGRLIIWRPLKPIFFQILGFGLSSRKFLRARVKTADSLRRNPFACGYPSLPAPYFRIFQGRLCAPYRLGPWTAARLARPLVRPFLVSPSVNTLTVLLQYSLKGEGITKASRAVFCSRRQCHDRREQWDMHHLRLQQMRCSTSNRRKEAGVQDWRTVCYKGCGYWVQTGTCMYSFINTSLLAHSTDSIRLN